MLSLRFATSITMESKAKKARRPAGPGSLTALALGLAKQLAAAGGDGDNLVFSPLSIYSALALVAAGARGRTLDELLVLLGAGSRGELAEFVRGVAERALADGSRSGGPRVAFASGVWHDAARALRPAFRAAAVASFKAEARAVDFRGKPEEARKEINAWVAAATKNLIRSVLARGSVGPDTGVVLANAIYFKGRWEKPFSKGSTTVEKFYLLDGTAVDAPLMRSGRRQKIAVHDGFKVLKLPYTAAPSSAGAKRAEYSMCFFLPDARDGLWAMADEMAAGGADFVRDHLPSESVEVGKLRLPRFKMTFSTELKGVLKDMGLKVALDPDQCDLGDMAEDDGSGMPLYVSSVIHKAVVEVNEEGTEAAASTAAIVRIGASPRMAPPVTVDFVADHPFAFFIIEEVCGAIVFAGYVLDPTQT
ncbi:hypothetical protein ACP70R_049705 [Stipagrostis hirtigluma subsp. patula]